MQPLLTLEEECGSYNEDEEKAHSKSISILKDRELESNVKDDPDTNNIIKKEENDEEQNSSHDAHASRNEIYEKYEKYSFKGQKRNVDSAEVARKKFPNIEQQMDDLIKDFISNPTCEGERRLNAWIETQISHLRAIKYLQR